jgi:hypothetical protein
MKTIKTSRQFKGSPISIRALCELEGRSLPVSMLDIVATDDVRNFSGEISTGDVSCSWQMTVCQNGFWSVNGDFSDDGILTGDFFYAEFRLGGDHHSVGARLEGSILNIVDSRHLSVAKSGSDPWVRENWHSFEASGPSVTLHAAPAIGGLIYVPLTALAIAAYVYFKSWSGAGDSFVTRPCEEQGPTRACVQISPTQNDDDNP